MLNIQDLENKIINADCMDILKQLPDKCVDLVLTDPPYGGGGYLGSKRTRTLRRTLQQVPYQQHGQAGATSRNTCKGVSLKTIPTLDTGMSPPVKKSLMKFSGFPKTKSSGEEIILTRPRQDVLMFGASSQLAKNLQWPWQSMLGRLLTTMQNYGNLPHKIRADSTQHKNPLHLLQSKLNCIQRKGKPSWIVSVEVALPRSPATDWDENLSALKRTKFTTKEVSNDLKKNKGRGGFYD